MTKSGSVIPTPPEGPFSVHEELAALSTAELQQMHGQLQPSEPFPENRNPEPYKHFAEQKVYESAYEAGKNLFDKMLAETKRKIDFLTGLPNKEALSDAYERLRQKPPDQPRRGSDKEPQASVSHSIIFGDLDHFSAYNETLGHGTTDQLLKAVTARLQQVQLRPGDIIGRFGGDEIVWLLPRTSVDDAVKVAERLRQAVKHEAYQAGEHVVRPTMTFGVAAIDPDHRFEETQNTASKTMTIAKKGGFRDSVSKLEDLPLAS